MDNGKKPLRNLAPVGSENTMKIPKRPAVQDQEKRGHKRNKSSVSAQLQNAEQANRILSEENQHLQQNNSKFLHYVIGNIREYAEAHFDNTVASVAHLPDEHEETKRVLGDANPKYHEELRDGFRRYFNRRFGSCGG